MELPTSVPETWKERKGSAPTRLKARITRVQAIWAQATYADVVALDAGRPSERVAVPGNAGKLDVHGLAFATKTRCQTGRQRQFGAGTVN